MPWAAAASVAGSLISSSMSSGTASGASDRADPFGSQRGQYQDQLSALMRDPSSVSKLPGYQFEFDQGMQALSRGQAAAGNLGGGTANAADIQFGQNFAQTKFMDWEKILSHLAGADTGDPGTAGSLYGKYTDQGNQALEGGIGTLMSGLGGWAKGGFSMGGGSSGPNYGGGGNV